MLLGAGIDTINAYFYDDAIPSQYPQLEYKPKHIQSKKFYYALGRLDTSHLRTGFNKINDMIESITESKEYTITRADAYIDLDIDLLIFSRILKIKRFTKIIYDTGSVLKTRDRMLRVYDKKEESKRKKKSIIHTYDNYTNVWRFEWQNRFKKNMYLNTLSLQKEIEGNYSLINYNTTIEKPSKITPYKTLIYRVLKEYGLNCIELIKSVEKNTTRAKYLEDVILESIEEIDLRKDINAGIERVKNCCIIPYENENYNYDRIRKISKQRKT